jgi:hypothetical protein
MTDTEAAAPGINGATICTRMGIYFNFADPRPEQINAVDIAWGLAHTCRFGGHTNTFYSVAQHCVLAAELARAAGASLAVQRDVLMHDASEAYTGDMVRPLKNLLPDFRAIEKRIERVIEERFGLTCEANKDEIKTLDLIMLKTEQRDLTAAAGHQWSGLHNIEAMKACIIPNPPEVAFGHFMFLWDSLCSQMGVSNR